MVATVFVLSKSTPRTGIMWLTVMRGALGEIGAGASPWFAASG